MTISLRLNEEDGKLIKSYAELNGMSISELVRQAVLEHIEEKYDLQAYEKALQAYHADPVTYSQEEVERELGLR